MITTFWHSQTAKNILQKMQKKNKELNSIEDRKVNKLTNFCLDGRKMFVTWQIVVFKTKMNPVSINAAANCNEHILWSDDVMPSLFT